MNCVEVRNPNQKTGTDSSNAAITRNRIFRVYFDAQNMEHNDITPKRLELIHHIRTKGPSNIQELAKATKSSFLDVHSDVAKMLELSLLEHGEGETVVCTIDEVIVHYRLD